MPFISIAIPVYNNPRVDRCIDSILRQDYEDYEIIVINDGSTDETLKTLNEKYLNNDKVKVFSYENEGLAEARNRSVNRANGKYLWMIDSDDYIEDNSLSKIVSVIKKYESDLVFIDYSIRNEENAVIKNKYISNGLPEGLITKDDLFRYYMERRIHSYAWDYVTLKSNYCNVIYPKGANYEDIATTYKVFKNCNKIYSLKEKIYNYIQTSGGITHTVTEKNIYDLDAASKIMLGDIKSNFPELDRLCILFYLGVKLNTFSNMKKISNTKAREIFDFIKEYVDQNKIKLWELRGSSYYFKFLKFKVSIFYEFIK